MLVVFDESTLVHLCLLRDVLRVKVWFNLVIGLTVEGRQLFTEECPEHNFVGYFDDQEVQGSRMICMITLSLWSSDKQGQSMTLTVHWKMEFSGAFQLKVWLTDFILQSY